MADLADAFIAIPGGFGTLEELLEVITWNQIGFMCKPVAVLNVAGYYDLLLQFLDKAVQEVLYTCDKSDASCVESIMLKTLLYDCAHCLLHVHACIVSASVCCQVLVLSCRGL